MIAAEEEENLRTKTKKRGLAIIKDEKFYNLLDGKNK